MLAYTYIEHGKFGLLEKPIPVLEDARDAIVRVTLGSTVHENSLEKFSELSINQGFLPRTFVLSIITSRHVLFHCRNKQKPLPIKVGV